VQKTIAVQKCEVCIMLAIINCALNCNTTFYLMHFSPIKYRSGSVAPSGFWKLQLISTERIEN